MTMRSADPVPASQRTHHRRQLSLLLAPGLTWLIAFFVLPLVIVLLYSFATPAPAGQGVIWEFSIDSYITLWTKDLYFNAYIRSLVIGVQTTIACLLLGYPLALSMTLAPPQRRVILLFLVLIPFWTNFLVRTYAWMLILSNNGIINSVLQLLGFAKQLLYPSEGAVLIGLIYGNLPFMVLPLFASLSRFDFTLMEAGSDLGASGWSRFWRIMFPLTLPGIVAGSVLVFIPTVGQFVVSDLLGGAKVDLLGNLLQRLFTRSNPPNWPLGSAMALVFMLLLTIVVIIYFRSTTEEDR
jgi:spermidine/putrescine transport system permease protein